jgi:hypothetical protein
MYWYFFITNRVGFEELLLPFGLFFSFNLFSFSYVYFYLFKRVLKLTTGKARWGSAAFALFISTLFPVCGLFLLFLYMLNKEDERKIDWFFLTQKHFLIPSCLALSLFIFPVTRNHIVTKVQWSPSGYYVMKSAHDLWRFSRLSDSLEKFCSPESMSDCTHELVMGMNDHPTITGVILGVAVDALAIFREKKSLEKQKPSKKKATNFLTVVKLVEHQVNFLNRSCNRVHPLKSLYLSPVDIFTGSPLVGLMAGQDYFFYDRWRNIAKDKMGLILKDVKKNKNNDRRIASLNRDLTTAASQICH